MVRDHRILSNVKSFPKIQEYGTILWKDAGNLAHNVNGPAEEYMDGDRAWAIHGRLHRLGSPAYESSHCHEWWENGKRHRMDGPAIEYTDGGKEWWVNNQRHRIDGPAVENPNGYNEWWINGHRQKVP